ncbi:L-serine ammonia-lyase [Candidatus Pseudothioglobus singularis]|jgi:L-serine dehydratase|nr:L-serine ammonia-lyase [Candidatus Pseudothioglobus singularis]MDA8813787.1 L-serine ammonia-lyase [Candidatus Pseudothioglobus singularis]MDB4597849.1 L-serine ammonia-lyase [Candidatus Pseudothioglobus singularis]MDC1066298.1 L-serine ammonia-lyase [Candidatus Pseudothioglobus singularis]MDC3262318.1 L-serine ammonia-lyase [Candidatus Pseudothioglobus singularis]
MFISVLDLFKVGIGPSSSHTMGPMVAANAFLQDIRHYIDSNPDTKNYQIRCTLKDSLAYTGVGHATDKAVTLGLHGYLPNTIINENMDEVHDRTWNSKTINISDDISASFFSEEDIIFDTRNSLKQHPNGLVFELLDDSGGLLLSSTFFSIGGGFISTLAEIDSVEAPIAAEPSSAYPYPFDNSDQMLEMSKKNKKTIWEMKLANELENLPEEILNLELDKIWNAMKTCVEKGLTTEGILPGGLNTKRRAKQLNESLENDKENAGSSDWLCAYAMAVNEENAAGHMVVTAPTNGAAGVVPATLYYYYKHKAASQEQIRQFLLSAAAIGGLIKHNSSISGAEVGCQGEVGSASSMAAAGLCAARGGTSEQIENAAEMALEHHIGMTCDPVKGLVQVPCIERNGFGAVKAYTASSLSLRESGEHLISLDQCIAAMKRTGLDMSTKYKETSLGGLAVSFIEC